MKVERIEKPSFSVIGKEGTTYDGEGFVQRLWIQANTQFPEVESLAKRNAKGEPVGFWGAMSDLSGAFLPWEENFSVGRYLAGVECTDDAQPPEGWSKWTVPGFVYLKVKCENENTFSDMIRYLTENAIPLAGAVQDFACPATGEDYMLFPIEKL